MIHIIRSNWWGNWLRFSHILGIAVLLHSCLILCKCLFHKVVNQCIRLWMSQLCMLIMGLSWVWQSLLLIDSNINILINSYSYLSIVRWNCYGSLIPGSEKALEATYLITSIFNQPYILAQSSLC